MARGDYLARTAGGFSPQDMNIQPASSPAQSFSSPQDMNIQPAVSVGFGQGQVDPGLAAAAGAGGITSTQQAQQQFTGPFTPNIPQQTGGTSGFGQGTDTSGQGTDTSGTDDEGKGLVETVLSNTVVANLLKGVQSTDRFFKNLSEKGVDGLTPEDKIILANLIGAGGLDTIDLNKYTTDDVDFEELGKRFTEAASGLENVDYQSLVDSYLSNKPTGIDSLTTMGSDLFNLFGDPRLRRDDATLPIEGAGSLTLEGLKKELGPEGIAYLKATNPKLYYSFTDPQTSGGLAELAQFDLSTLGNSPEDRQLAARVMAAREATSDQGGGGQTGIPSLYAGPITPSDPNAIFNKPATKYPEGYGAFLLNPPAPVRPGSPTQPGFPDKDGDGVDDRYQAGPGIPRPGIESVGSLKPIKTNLPVTFDYASMAPQFTGSQYTNQGVSPAFLKNLRKFYG